MIFTIYPHLSNIDRLRKSVNIGENEWKFNGTLSGPLVPCWFSCNLTKEKRTVFELTT